MIIGIYHERFVPTIHYQLHFHRFCKVNVALWRTWTTKFSLW